MLSGYSRTYSQIIPTEGLYEYQSIFQQKNIQISERIKENWNLPYTVLQQIYYNANKDSEINSVQSITQVLSIHYLSNNTRNIVELLDDGKHFDKEAHDGIYGNFLIGDFNELRTDETILDIQWDTLGINYTIVHPPVNYLPETPTILKPQHNSIISSTAPEISWTIDSEADGCGVILLGSDLLLGEELKNIVWQKEYSGNTNRFYIERIPVPLRSNKGYTLIIWSYTNTQQTNNNWSKGAYSVEWSKFYVDTLQKRLSLSQNYPNPFKSQTILKYFLPESGEVSIRIFDINGREITTLMEQKQAAGWHYISWDGKNQTGDEVVSGVYFCKIMFHNWSVSCKMILTR